MLHFRLPGGLELPIVAVFSVVVKLLALLFVLAFGELVLEPVLAVGLGLFALESGVYITIRILPGLRSST